MAVRKLCSSPGGVSVCVHRSNTWCWQEQDRQTLSLCALVADLRCLVRVAKEQRWDGDVETQWEIAVRLTG